MSEPQVNDEDYPETKALVYSCLNDKSMADSYVRMTRHAMSLERRLREKAGKLPWEAPSVETLSVPKDSECS